MVNFLFHGKYTIFMTFDFNMKQYFLLTARNVFRTQIVFNEFSLPFCEEATTHVFPQDGRGEL